MEALLSHELKLFEEKLKGHHTKKFTYSLREYFAINDHLILQKMKKMLFPFLKSDNAACDPYSTELFIPCMALITLVVFNTFLAGIHGTFTPASFYSFFFRYSTSHFLLAASIKLIAWMLGHSLAFLDILSVVCHKFILIIIYRIMGLLPGGNMLSYYLIIVYMVFEARTLKYALCRHGYQRNKNKFIFGVVLIDTILAFWIV
ncbi:protein transport protein YIF1 [Enteropsectra breve]|nr:protein transport protein YIF1 [Enteropsectra breve]